jgi:putative copper resistance protein D
VDAALAVARFVHFAAAMLLLGVASFAAVVMPARLRVRHERLARRSSLVLAVVVALSGFGWVALLVGMAGDGLGSITDWSLWRLYLTATDFGPVWMAHLALALLLVLAQALPAALRRWATLILTTGILASLGLLGHAALQSGPEGLVHRLSHALHLLGAGFWAGALGALALCLGALRTSLRDEAIVTLSRFSGLGHLAVAVTLITGLINTQLTLGHVPDDLHAPYQVLLLIKIALVAAMLGLALANRYVLTPRLVAGSNSAGRTLVATTLAELVLGAAVVGLVSVFASWDPA